MNRLSVVLIACLVATPALAKKNKVSHAAIVPPTWAGPAIGLDIGVVTAMKAQGDMLVLAGQKGVAAVDGTGAVKWTVPLPETMVRNIDVDAQGIAYTAWTVTGVADKAKAFNAWGLGELMDQFTVEGAKIGYIGLDGTAKWEVDSADQLPLSPPGLSPKSVGVNSGYHVISVSREDGHALGAGEIVGGLGSGYGASSGGPMKGVYDHGTRGEVVAVGDRWFTGFFSYLYRSDFDGTVQEKEFMAGLTPYVDITCGPVPVGDLLVFGTTGDSDVQSGFFAMNTEMKNKWKTWSPDIQSGCGDIVTEGDVIYASSNFYVMKMDAKGKILWESYNKKGGLYPSQNRGVRYIKGSSLGARKTYGDLMVAGGGKVWVATSSNKHDTITVLDASSGAYVQTLDVNETIVSMAIIGKHLAVATETGVKMIDL